MFLNLFGAREGLKFHSFNDVVGKMLGVLYRFCEILMKITLVFMKIRPATSGMTIFNENLGIS